MSESVSKFVKEEHKVLFEKTKEIAAEEEVELKAPKRKIIKLSERLGPKAAKINNKVKQENKDIDVSSFNLKTLKDLAPELTADLFGIPVKKLLSGAN